MLAPSFIPYTEKSPNHQNSICITKEPPSRVGYSDNAPQIHWYEQCLHAEIKISISPLPYEIRLFIFEIDRTGHTSSQTAHYYLLKKLIPYPKSELWDQVRHSASCRSLIADAGSNHP